MKKIKNAPIERDQSIIALDYLSMTGAKDLKDLQENFSYFYDKYLEEKNRISDIKETTKIPEIVPVHKVNFASIVDKIYFCEKCQKELIYIIYKKKLYYQDTPHQYNNGIAKVVCLCGEKNIFDFREEDEVTDK